jgi:retron-type reverse transcriptase
MYQSAYPNPMATSMLKQLATVSSLHQAWRKVRANRGSAGVDAISLQAFEKNLNANLAELSRNLINKTYEPLPARYVSVSKPNGKMRELAIPTVRDRVVQRAVLDLIEPLFEPQFLDCSYAFRPGRSVEMAIEKMIVARAHGLLWTVDADIKDFFPSINHSLLLDELSCTLDDSDILRLIQIWLDSGVFDGARPRAGWIARWRSSFAGANLAIRDAVDDLLDGFVSERLGLAGEQDFSDQLIEQSELIGEVEDQLPLQAYEAPRKSKFGRAAVRRLVQDGLLLALAERAALKSVRAAKMIGIGGAAFMLAAATPTILRKLKSKTTPKTGASQGAPISPLLSNIYLHPFDTTLTIAGQRLIRYCDDFVILCRSEAEAREALVFAEMTVSERRLRLSPEKTRLVSPDEDFDFLGYHFNPDGSITPPPSVPEVVTRQVVDLARRYRLRASRQVNSAIKKTGDVVRRVKAQMKRGDK